MKPANDYQARWTVSWCTSYGFDPTLYESFLLPRLGEPPLNAVALVDFGRLARTWDGIEAADMWRVRRANRDYLIRGVSIGNGAFHPKTYFFANAKEAVLLVGSGNLSLSGLEMGHETFARFTSDDEPGSATIRAWMAWMGQAVSAIDDGMLTNRWLDLRTRVAWLPSADLVTPAFVTNWDRPLVDALTEGLRVPVDELHLLAPFYDSDIGALTRLLGDTQPSEVHLYLSPETKVDGARLTRVLAAQSGAVHLHGFDPPDFVHAKLIAAIGGDRARVLSGSANASRPALLSTVVGGGHTNVEACTVVDLPAAVARGLFTPLGMELRPMGLDEVTQLEFRADPEEALPALRLASAHLTPAGHLALDIQPASAWAGPLFVTDGLSIGLVEDDTTAEPFAAAPERVFVWLTDSEGLRLSNRVAVDDRVQLARRLDQRTGAGETPAGLDLGDLGHPAGDMLARLHRECIFDFSETSAAQRIKRLPEEIEDPDFWDNFAKEELHQDPRVSRYATVRSGDLLQDDVFVLLDQLLHQAPRPGYLRVVGAGRLTDPEESDPGEATRWSTDRRFQVRIFNVLQRWSEALGDPRLMWIDALAPVRNYAAILSALVECWVQEFLPEHRVMVLVETLLGAFVRTDRSVGYLFTLDDDEQSAAVQLLGSSGAPAVAAALTYAALRPGAPDVLDRVFRLQSTLISALDLGVMHPSAGSSELVSSLIGTSATPAEIEARLKWASSYVDDDHWCASLKREYDLSHVSLARDHSLFGLTVSVVGVTKPLADGRVIGIARHALDYGRTEAVILSLPSGRVSIRLNGDAFARLGARDFESNRPITHELLEQLEAAGGGLEAIMQVAKERAS